MAAIESFKELAERAKREDEEPDFPGQRHAPPEDEVEGDLLDGEDRRVMEVAGVEREFYSIGALARALNREVQTIRLWERRGYLPDAVYRAPGRKKDRLYTRLQIVGLHALATEEGLMDPTKKKRIDQTRFPERAHKLFVALKKAGK